MGILSLAIKVHASSEAQISQLFNMGTFFKILTATSLIRLKIMCNIHPILNYLFKFNHFLHYVKTTGYSYTIAEMA